MKAFKLIPPQMTHHYNLKISGMSEEYNSIIRNNVIDYKLDLIKKTIEVSIRQTIIADSFLAVEYLTRNGTPMLQAMSHGGDNTTFVIRPVAAKCISHELVFDYAVGAVATHKLVWTFDRCEAFDPSAVPAEVEYDPEFISPAEAIALMTKTS